MKGVCTLENQQTKLLHEEIADNLAYIKTVTSPQKQFGKQTGPYLILWGIIWIVGCSISLTNWFAIIPWSWLLLGIIGWTITFYFYRKQEKNESIPIVLKNQLKIVLFGCAFLVVIFLFLIYSNMLPSSIEMIFFYMTLLISIMYVFLGAIFGKELSFIGCWLGILTMITFICFSPYAEIIYATVGGGSLLLAGLWLTFWSKGND